MRVCNIFVRNIREITRRASSVSNFYFFYKTEGLRVKDEGGMYNGEGGLIFK